MDCARAVLFGDAPGCNDRDRSSAARPLVLAPVNTTSRAVPQRDRTPARATKEGASKFRFAFCLPNVPLFSCGRIRKPGAIRWQRASPWVHHHGREVGGSGHDRARPPAATACWPADETSCQSAQPRVNCDRRHWARSAEGRVQREAQRAPGTETQGPRWQPWPPEAKETGGQLDVWRRTASRPWLPEAKETGTLPRARVWCPRRPRSQRARARRPSVHLSRSRPAASSSSVPLGRDRSPSL